MEDSDDQDVPQRLLDMLRIFLAASKRGDNAALILETRDKDIITKYRSVEPAAGFPAATNAPITVNAPKRKMNPARARRSLARLENFIKKKEDDKLRQEKTGRKTVAGESSSSSSQIVVDLGEGLNLAEKAGPNSPIPQVDGTLEIKDVAYTFKSEYGEEDIRHSLEEIFPPFVASLDSRVRLGRLEADHQCIVSLRNPFGQTDVLSWPEMDSGDDVFREVTRIS